MSDLGQDKESLELKVMELKYSIGQSSLAKQNIELQEAQIALKLKHYARSRAEIDLKIKEHERNIESLQEAISNLE